MLEQLERNRARFNRYKDELVDLPELRLIEQNFDTGPSHKNIVIEVLDDWPFTRDQTIQLLNAENILARAYYAPPLTQKKMNYVSVVGELANTDWVAERFISMPCGHLVSLGDIGKIVSFLRTIRGIAEKIIEAMNIHATEDSSG